jgi:hypothetical protein
MYPLQLRNYTATQEIISKALAKHSMDNDVSSKTNDMTTVLYSTALRGLFFGAVGFSLAGLYYVKERKWCKCTASIAMVLVCAGAALTVIFKGKV